MSRYVANWEYTTAFEGDDVRITLKPMSRLMALRFSAVNADAEMNEGLMRLYEDAVQESVVSLSGLRDAAGLNVPLESVLRDAYFTQLIMDIGTELVRRATPANPD